MGRGVKACVILLALCLAPLLVYSPSLRYDFVTFDDGLHVYQNPRFHPPTVKKVLPFWTAPYQGLYVPLTYTVWAVEAFFSPRKSAKHDGWPQHQSAEHDGWPQLSPFLFHLGNLLFHGANVVMVYLLLTTLTFSTPASFFAALLFAWHPLQVEPVAWISALKDLLSGFFSLLAVWLFLQRRRGAFASYCLALFAKPSALMVAPLAAILDWAFFRRFDKKLIAWVVAAIPFVLITKRLQPNQALDFIPSLGQRFIVALDACAFYLGKLIFPLMLTVNYGRTPEVVLKSALTPLLLVLPIVLAFFYWRRREWKVGWLGLSLFFLLPLPVLGIIPFYYQKFSTVADRYVYLALLGPAMMMAYFLSNGGKARYALAALALFFLAARSHQQLGMWENNRTLIRQIGKMNPQDPDVQYSLAVVLSEESQLPGQTSFYSEMLRLPVEERSESVRLERQQQAIFHYERAISLNPRHAFAHNNLGLVLHRMGRLQEAESHFRSAVEIEPQMGQAHNNLGSTLAQQGKLREALEHFQKAAELAPKDQSVQGNLSRVQAILKKGAKG